MRTLRIRFASLVAAVALAAPSAPMVVAAGHAFLPDIGTQPRAVPVTRGADLLFGCQLRVIDDPSGGPACYDPDTIRKAYGFSGLLAHGIDGHGRTIVIVDAYSNPLIVSDLQLFDAAFGLPDPTFNQVAPDGLTPFDINDGNQVGWSAEISLDVQWAHAMAPGAALSLVLAKSSDDGDINSALRYAVDHNLGDVISMSFGEGEACMSSANLAFQHETFRRAVRKGITLVASSGDDGAAQGTQGPDACDFGGAFFKSASTPASDPLVTGVGGTTLSAQDPALGSAGYQAERAWSDPFSGRADAANNPISGCYPPSDFGCSGGGFSTLFDRPSYQAGVPNTNRRHRGVPDVSYNAGVDGGVLVHWGVGLETIGIGPDDPDFPNIFFIFGGTSAGAPQWSALVALADQLGHHRVGTINDALYAISHSRALYAAAFHDVTTGNNNLDTVDGTIAGFDATRNWDPVTGLGSPKAGFLVPYLALVSH